jgi:hypothetical protein
LFGLKKLTLTQDRRGLSGGIASNCAQFGRRSGRASVLPAARNGDHK